MKNIIKYIMCGAALLATTALADEQTYSLSGVILDAQGMPVTDAVLTVPGHGLVRADEQGKFTIKAAEQWASVRVQANGYYDKIIRVTGGDQSSLQVYLVPADLRQYNETQVQGILGSFDGQVHAGGVQNVSKKDFSLSAVTLDKALQGSLTGLNITQKSGMTGEGSLLTLRGIRSLVAESNPLIVINGIPYLPDMTESGLIQGYSRSIFQSINPQDVANVTLLTGAQAAAWGSLGSNGVLLIETDGATSDDLDTRITFAGSWGLNYNNRTLPLMNASQYKSYLTDMGMSYYGNDMNAFVSNFGFMNSASAVGAHLYAFDTDWQDYLFETSQTHDYLFRVEGGDAIAKYDIALGYMGDKGVLKNTGTDRFHAQINANMLLGKKWQINANINLAYLSGNYQEQGFSLETNPMLAAYRRAPLLSPYKTSDIPSADGTFALLPSYASYRFGSSNNSDLFVSNPVSLINDVDGTIRQYDLNARFQLVYNPIQDVTLAATVALYSNFDKEKLFVPGIDNSDIVPRFDQFGQSDNTIQVGDGTVFNLYYGVNARYHHLWQRKHDLDVRAGLQVMQNKNEYDVSSGRNTINDFYQTLSDISSDSKAFLSFTGHNQKWNWLNMYATADYTFADYVRASVAASVDGASSIGSDATRMSLYPSASVNVMLGNLIPQLRRQSWLDRLDVFADYSMTGNSRFSSKYGQYYYTARPFQSVAGLVRATVPNKNLKAEVDHTFQVGIDLGVMDNRYTVRGTFFNTKATNVLMLGRNSSVFGTSPSYNNDAEITSRGFEVAVTLVPIQTRDWRWSLGATSTFLTNEVNSLGALNDYLTTLSDGGEILTRVGEAPYSFYGYKTAGVYSTTAEAKAIQDKTGKPLMNRNGVEYQAGDVRYVDVNHDGIINDQDKVVLGSAKPDMFGSLFTSLEYKGFALDLNFVYSVGNKAYNATRRLTESSKDFGNQALSVMRRWQNEGDVTDVPRAAWGDVIGNNDMSDRFVESASYLKLRDVTLSYSWKKKIFGFLLPGTVYVSGQNLLCFTDYLGVDPEFAYSNTASMQGVDYGKVALPRSFKVGVNLHF